MYLLNYTEACNEFAQPISASLRPAGPPRGGQGGQWHRGPWSLGSPWAREEVHPNDIEKWKTHRNLMWRPEKSLKFRRRLFFFFWDHLIFAGKTVEIPVKTLFFSFGDHISFQIKQQHFLRLFWTSHYENSVMLELAPGPRLTLGAPGARATQLLLNNCHNGGEPLATLCLIWSAGDLNRRPPAPETNVLPLDQLVGLDCLS